MEEARGEIPNLQTYRKGVGDLLPDWKQLEASIHGTDVSRQMMRIAVMNLVLHGIRGARVKRANVLSEMSGLTEDDLHRQYKVILSNPPFAGQIPRESIRADLPTKSKKSELLFLSLMMRSLAPGGRCAVVVPEGALFGSTKAHKELREKLLREFEVLAVVSLPAGVFKPYAGVKTSVLVFRRPTTAPDEGTAATGQVWFYEVANDGYDPDKIQQGGRPVTPTENDIPGLLVAWRRTTPPASKMRLVSMAEACFRPEAKSLTPGPYLSIESPTVISIWPPLATSRSLRNLSLKRTCRLIKSLLKIENKITQGLRNLLKEVGERREA